MDDYIPITPPEFYDAEHYFTINSTSRVAQAFRISIEHNVPVSELMFGNYSRLNNYK